jgi:hypothetical protein
MAWHASLARVTPRREVSTRRKRGGTFYRRSKMASPVIAATVAAAVRVTATTITAKKGRQVVSLFTITQNLFIMLSI